jgi:hypothetical protein
MVYHPIPFQGYATLFNGEAISLNNTRILKERENPVESQAVVSLACHCAKLGLQIPILW